MDDSLREILLAEFQWAGYSTLICQQWTEQMYYVEPSGVHIVRGYVVQVKATMQKTGLFAFQEPTIVE